MAELNNGGLVCLLLKGDLIVIVMWMDKTTECCVVQLVNGDLKGGEV